MNKDKIRINRVDANEFKVQQGQIQIPDGYELYKVPTRKEKIQSRISQLTKDLEKMKEPSQQDLIEVGRMMHPYYSITEEIEYYQKRLSNGNN